MLCLHLSIYLQCCAHVCNEVYVKATSDHTKTVTMVMAIPQSSTSLAPTCLNSTRDASAPAGRAIEIQNSVTRKPPNQPPRTATTII